MEIETTNHHPGKRPTVRIDDGEDIGKRSKYIPLRLSVDERELLSILEGALEISEYTDKVDIARNMFGMGLGRKTDSIERELKRMLAFLSGLYMSGHYQFGSKLLIKDENQDFRANEEFFQNVFEIGRRYKIMNPEKMRTNYGKLMYMLQDAVSESSIDIKCKIDIKTVHKFLESKNKLELLDDENLIIATQCIESSFREEVEKQLVDKTAARQKLAQTWIDNNFSQDDLTTVIESLTDSNAYILANRYPVDRMIEYLKHYFNPLEEKKDTSLEIRRGKGGSCLSHDHRTQYKFVHQSLQLWREIMHNMFKLWIFSDDDLLGRCTYRLTNTGQGLMRVQPAPAVSRAMGSILKTVQSRVGSWVGLSVVHLGDRDVPSALVFIDKYTQVSRILAPIVKTLDRIGELENDTKVGPFIKHFGGTESIRIQILRDFFKHGFDGSGDDGGSCIDGRLTSSWNWCSRLEKKPFYPIFMLTGFQGFDGSFKK